MKVAAASAFAIPAVALRLAGVHLAPPLAIPVFGAAVVACAFLLVWAAEAAHHDISGSLATAILAVIAVLPEYAVDLYFAWSAGHIPQNAQYAAANMTGSNRLLLGLGCSSRSSSPGGRAVAASPPDRCGFAKGAGWSCASSGWPASTP
jgi:cation:H+ antiporter